ncbi:MAG: threonylcarbamoyl-AMP synthase [Flavobacteriales bacterium]|nr:threonylcarbamoyl-AMP synthase [Flavobacteriales bacterium]
MQEQIHKCIEILKAGGIILYPTDTVWGLGCDATNQEAVKKIYQIKQREDSKSLITLVSSDAMLQRYVIEVPELAWDLIDLATKPTTVIFPKGKNLAPNVIAQDGSIGIRMIKEGFCNQLVHKFGKAIVSTSANISETPSPSYFHDISPEIISKVDFIVDSLLDKGTHQPSSIIKIGLKGEIEVLRK